MSQYKWQLMSKLEKTEVAFKVLSSKQEGQSED